MHFFGCKKVENFAFIWYNTLDYYIIIIIYIRVVYIMPVNSIEDIWAVICEECKKTISEFAFDCFFVKLKPVSLSGGEFYISCNDE